MEVHVRLVTQLPSNGLYEGFVARPNGSLIVSRVDEPELYQVDFNAEGEEEARLLYTFPESTGINGIINICDIPGADDEFVLLVGNLDVAAVGASDWQLWKFSIPDGGDPEVKKIVRLDDEGFFIGIAAVSDRTLLVTDSARYSVYSVDMATGETELVVTHESFSPAPEAFFGVNRLHVDERGFAWFTNSSRNLLGKFRVDLAQPGTTPRLLDDVEIVAEGMPAADGIAVMPDHSAVFFTTMHDNKLMRVGLAGAGQDKPISDLEIDLVNPTAVGFIPSPASNGGTLQIGVVCSGKFEAVWKNHDPSAGWQDIADIVNQVTVTVTVSEE